MVDFRWQTLEVVAGLLCCKRKDSTRRNGFCVTESLSIISDGKCSGFGEDSSAGRTAVGKTYGFVFSASKKRKTCGFAAPDRLGETPLSPCDISPFRGEKYFIKWKCQEKYSRKIP